MTSSLGKPFNNHRFSIDLEVYTFTHTHSFSVDLEVYTCAQSTKNDEFQCSGTYDRCMDDQC